MPDDLNRFERHCIHTLEAAGVTLRNLAHMSVVQGERDLDLVISPEEQNAWLSASEPIFDSDIHIQDQALRARHRRKFEEFLTLPFAQDALFLLGLYLREVVPFPRRTELTFWMVSCLPYGTKRESHVYLRLSLNMQETFTLYGTAAGLECSFHLARSPFETELGADWEAALLEEGWDVEQHAYAPGGQDQFNLWCAGREGATVLLNDATATQAMALLNLRLMRKGATYYGSSHCLDLVDAAMEAIQAQAP